MQDTNNWWTAYVVRMGWTQKGIVLGLVIGASAGLIGLGIALLGPVYMAAGVIGVLAGLYILTDLEVALFAIFAVLGLLPYGTLPFKIVITPSFLDITAAAFLMVYVFQWMTGRRRVFRATPVHGLILAFALVVLAAFVLGLGNAPLTNNILKQFAEMMLSIAIAFVLADVIREERTLRRVLLGVVFVSGVTALIGIVLYILPDNLTEFVLVRFARFGYPNGGVVRYVEDNPAMAERAIGVWIDPNAYGGVLAVLGALIVPQVFAARPLGGRRWLVTGVLGAVGVAVLLTFSRGAMLSLAAAMFFIAVVRYRKLLWLMIAGGVVFLLLPFTQDYIVRLVEGFMFADQATQMRVGEIQDALELIGRYPLFGVGFTGTPTRDIYLGVANLYLTMAGNTGFLGLGTFFVMIGGLFLYGSTAWQRPGRPARFEPYFLGIYAAIVAVLAAGVFDHYFFRLEFQPSGALFWIMIGLAVTVTRLWLVADPDPEPADTSAAAED
jgi:hypothetical protein